MFKNISLSLSLNLFITLAENIKPMEINIEIDLFELEKIVETSAFLI
jgi:hypothetical protein